MSRLHLNVRTRNASTRHSYLGRLVNDQLSGGADTRMDELNYEDDSESLEEGEPLNALDWISTDSSVIPHADRRKRERVNERE